MGRPLSGNTSHQAWRSPPGDRRWHSSEQLLEYRTSSQVLPLRRGCREPRQPPFRTSLAAEACNPMYGARRRPCAQSGKRNPLVCIVSCRFACLCIYVYACLSRVLYCFLIPINVSGPPRFHALALSSFQPRQGRAIPPRTQPQQEFEKTTWHGDPRQTKQIKFTSCPFVFVTYDLCIRKPHRSPLKTRILPFPARTLLRSEWS